MNLESKILLENAVMHDAIADYHNLNVPYINRQSTKLFYQKLILEHFDKKPKPERPIRVLELGCGTGTFVEMFAQNNFSYVGVDLSERMIEISKINFRGRNNVEFFCTDLKSFSSTSIDKFDLIVSSSFLHHLHDLEDGLVDISNLLNKTGVYVGLHEPIVPHKQSFFNKIDTIFAMIIGSYFGQYNFLTRAILVICGYFNLDKMGERSNWFDIFQFYSYLKNGKLRNSKAEEVNYVDFQLNNDFDLSNRTFSEIMDSKIEIVKYNFSVFSLIRKLDFSNPNYTALILKKLNS